MCFWHGYTVFGCVYPWFCMSSYVIIIRMDQRWSECDAWQGRSRPRRSQSRRSAPCSKENALRIFCVHLLRTRALMPQSHPKSGQLSWNESIWVRATAELKVSQSPHSKTNAVKISQTFTSRTGVGPAQARQTPTWSGQVWDCWYWENQQWY